jgi:D-threonate/D-erythronate kinase
VSHAQVARLKREFPNVAVVLAPTERVPGAAIADDLADKFARLAAEREWDVFGLIGGDGARAALKRLGASGIRIVDAVIEGIPVGFIAGGSADGTAVFTKAGGFGAEDAIVRVVERIRA